MALPDIFSEQVCNGIIERIEKLTPQTQPLWGTMDVAKMLAHCCVTYEYVYDDKYPKPNFFMGFIMKVLVKPTVVGEKPYERNSRTGPDFLISDARVFETEKKRLIQYLQRVQKEGRSAFEGRASHSFGNLNATEWNNMFYKHIDHHLKQFGV